MKDFETSGFTKTSLCCALSPCDLIPRFLKRKKQKRTLRMLLFLHLKNYELVLNNILVLTTNDLL